jgi:hypothetical protein
MLGSQRCRAAAGLARVVGPVQCAPTWTARSTGLSSQFMIDTQQQREELRVLQQGMAHWRGL